MSDEKELGIWLESTASRVFKSHMSTIPVLSRKYSKDIIIFYARALFSALPLALGLHETCLQ